MRYLIKGEEKNIKRWRFWRKELTLDEELTRKEILYSIQHAIMDIPKKNKIAQQAVREGRYKIVKDPPIVIEGQNMFEVIINLTPEEEEIIKGLVLYKKPNETQHISNKKTMDSVG